MKKSGGKYFIVIILAISFAATVMDYAKAEAQWEAKWQTVLEAGKKEGKVSVYASLIAPTLRNQAPVFKKQFGIDLEVTAGRGADLSRKLRTEKTAGVNAADVVISGGNTFFAVKKLGVTTSMEDKLILPEVTNPKLWYTRDRLPWTDDDKHVFHYFAYPDRDITVNTDLVKPGEIQSWQDLLKPQFKGKTVWSDPSIPGMGFNTFSSLIMHKVLDENFYRKLVATQDIALSRNLRQMGEWLAKGKYSVAVSVEGRPIAEMLNAGAHIAYVTVKEGTTLSFDAANVGMAAQAPHPNAAIVFVNWLLSKEGQIFAQNSTKYHSSRIDIPTDACDPQTMRVPGEKYLVGANTMEKWVMQEQDKYIQLAKDIFGPVIGR
ncbi:MAG: extracellular solute-binding protein [Desulfobacterales bacterium]|nr:extracellular solute-binding protein [Desulfobacterales bacterium]